MTVFGMLGRFFATFAMNSGLQIAAEIFPTELRGQGLAVSSTLGVSATLLSPLIVYSVSIAILTSIVCQACCDSIFKLHFRQSMVKEYRSLS